jgi:hypothetical protein
MPANQTLILAGESLPGTAAGLVNSGALKRVTIVEARSATTLVVQADYYPQSESLPVRRMSASVGSGSTHSKPIELYVRTQRGLEERPRAALVDVLA